MKKNKNQKNNQDGPVTIINDEYIDETDKASSENTDNDDDDEEEEETEEENDEDNGDKERIKDEI